VLGTFVQHLVVHLVGVDRQVMLAGDVDDFAQQVIGIQRTGRVVRVDQHDRLGMGVDLAADIVEIWQPALGLIAQVVLGRPAREADRRGPQGIIRRRDQHLVTGIEQRVHRHDDQFRNAIADVNVVQRHTLDTLLLGVMHDRLARREDALRIGITGRVRQVADHVLLDFLGRIEAEGSEVADVQLDDLVTLFLHLLGLLQHRAADVVADVGEFGGFLDVFHAMVPAKPLIAH